MYILAEKGEDLIIIDQHAAHERVLYEQVLRTKKSRVQELITPVMIELTPKEKVLMEEYIPCLEEVRLRNLGIWGQHLCCYLCP